MVVWKYVLQAVDMQIIQMPEGAELLTAGTQRDDICIWARVNPGAPMVDRTIHTRGTGHVDAEGVYVGTGFLLGGALVFHVFDGGE